MGTQERNHQIQKLKSILDTADAVVIGAGAGLSTSAGLTYNGDRFHTYFKDFADAFGIRDMYSGGFYPFPDLETNWAWWSRHIYINRYIRAPRPVYQNLLQLVREKDYFVITTNVDHQFQKAGFEKQRLFYTQGDYGLWQCSRPCHKRTYDNKEKVVKMLLAQGFFIGENGDLLLPEKADGTAARDRLLMRIPSDLVPYCPVCGEPMSMNLRADDTFVEDAGWHAAASAYADFLNRHKSGRVLFLEPGVGGNTPGIIKYPFWRMTNDNPQAVYACLNYNEIYCPTEIKERSICIDGDTGEIFAQMLEIR